MNDYAALTLGVVCAGVGGEFFVRGAVGLAHWARVSPGIIGATVAAFATSSPELSVAINAALAGKPQISLGDALGSNVVNVALALVISGIQSPRHSGLFIVAVAAVIYPMTVSWREVAVALVFGLMAVVFTYPGRTGFIERRRGILLLAFYAGYLATILQR